MARDAIKRTGGNGRRSTAVSYDGLVYTSGVTTTALQEAVRGQTQDVLQQLDAILARHGTDKSRVLRADITLTDMADYGEFNAAWDEWVTDNEEPVRSVTQGGLAVEGYRVKIALIAANG